MKSYEAKKHWWSWLLPVSIALIITLLILPVSLSEVYGLFLYIIPILIILWPALRWKLDKIEIKDGCLYSRMGVIFIDKKLIPLEQISFVTEKMNIFSQFLGFGSIIIQSSAFAKAIDYPYISNPSEFVQAINEAKKKNSK